MRFRHAFVAAAMLPWPAGGGASAALADAPYQAYVYNEWNESKASPNGYVPERVVTGLEAGAGHFNEPQDLFADGEGAVYVADTGNDRIVKLDASLRASGVIESLEWNGRPTALSEPTGIFVAEDGTLYVADHGNGRVLRANATGRVELVLEQPKHPLIPEDFVFKPKKVAADAAGRMYVLSEGQFFGLMQFDRDGAFLGYFGSNKVEVTPAVVLETFWKSVLTKEQREGMIKLLPIEYSNLDMGADGFVYTTTIVSANSRQEIKKLNPLGNNVMTGRDGENDFGDKEIPLSKTVKLDTSFIDVAIDADGFIAGLDRTRGRVFEYDREGNPTSVFGALGQQAGTFLQPSAVEYWNDSVLVLDAGKRNVTRFVRSEYGRLVREATVLYNEGLYEEAADVWAEASKRNVHNEMAYIGMAKSLEKQERYEEAMRYYRLGTDRSGYSDTFAFLRIDAVRASLPFVMTALLVFVFGYYGFKIIRFARSVKGRGRAHGASQGPSSGPGSTPGPTKSA
ncbi:hypothetical protein [Paenibacillus sp.]|uniref:hypothetical protein n=1 Tax=Paenibacillus sp. TaxID=58172 RepID=UPI002810D57F|nr:hypothetical protein [Paenibacillus sp.]